MIKKGTTCWRAHREGQPQILIVIKDSRQCLECGEEGDLLRYAAGKGIINTARYYHH